MTTRIRRARELSGLTIGQASRLLGIGIVDLSDEEMGRRRPDEREMRELADAYGVSVSWIGGAEPVVSLEIQNLLRNADISSDDRDSLTELLGSMRSDLGGEGGS